MYIPAKINSNLARILQKLVFLVLLSFYNPAIVFGQEQKIAHDRLLQNKKQQITDSLIKRGFLEASVSWSSEDSVIEILNGERFKWQEIQIYEENSPIELKEIKKLGGNFADQIELQKILQRVLLESYHQQGYPLASAALQIQELNQNFVKASIQIEKRNFIVYDTIGIETEKELINQKYLANYLGIEKGEPFDIKSFQAVPSRIEQLDFVRMKNMPSLLFANNLAQIKVDLVAEMTNQVDAIIGLIPEGDNTYLTGQVDLSLQNLFKRAIGLDLNWQKYSANSQFLNTSIQQTHAFNSKLGFHFRFKLLQEDSTFLSNDLNIGVNYPLPQQILLGISYQRLSNNVLREFEEIANSNTVFRSSQIDGLLLSLNWRNEITYPILKNHINAKVEGQLGNKQIKNYSNLPAEWQNVPERSFNYGAIIELSKQYIFWKRFLLESNFEFAFIENQALSQNDLLRLGGLQNLRGFDRNFFYTQSYLLTNFNYRYFLDQKSSFFLLTDFAKLQPEIGWVYAFGAGLDIKNKNGWFRLIYALGANTTDQLDISTGKIHLGYISVF